MCIEEYVLEEEDVKSIFQGCRWKGGLESGRENKLG